MNIPENILQQVADEAFESSNGGAMGLLTCIKTNNNLVWSEERYARRAVIQHAISNPAIAPFLAGGVGKYTDEEIQEAWVNSRSLRAFLAALPRRESQALAEAIARAEKAEAELTSIKSSLPDAEVTPPADPEPSAQVPLGPEDVPPGSVIFAKGTDIQAMVVRVCDSGMWIYGIRGHAYEVCFQEAFDDWQINTSIPDTGRWDAKAWRPCSKPGKEVAK